MKDILSLFFYYLAFFHLSLCLGWKIEYKELSSTSSTLSTTIQKGEYHPIIVTFIKDNSQFWDVKGKLVLEDANFKLAEQVSVNLAGQRQYQINIGISCQAPLTPGNEFTLNFQLDTKDSDSIQWTPLKATVQAEKLPLAIKLEREVIELSSYSLYTISSVRNFDPIKIVYTLEGDGIYFPSYYLPSFTPATRRGLKLYGTFSSEYKEKDELRTVRPSIDNTCFTVTEKLTWKTSLTNLFDVYDKKELILADTDVDKSEGNKAGFHLKLDFKPVLVSCGISTVRDETLLTQEIVTHPFKYADKRSIDLEFFQTYHQVEGTVNVFSNQTNRFSLGLTAICYIQSLMFKNNIEQQETLRITLGNFGVVDKKLTLKSEIPFPTQCILWSFKSEFTVLDLENNLIKYCRQYFSSTQSLNERGCLYCDTRPRDHLLTTEMGICIRAYEGCPTNYPGNVKNDVAGFVVTLDTTEKMASNLHMQVPQLNTYTHVSDDEIIDPSKFNVKIKSITMKEAEIVTKTNFKQSIECFVKPINKQPFKNITEGDFMEIEERVVLIPNRENIIRFPFHNEGYDNITYNIVLMCFNFANYIYHSRHTDPFIFTTILRTDRVPEEKAEEEKHDCTKNNRHVQCINRVSIPTPELKSDDYKPDIDSELFDFSKLSIGYKYIMLKDEFEEYKIAKLPTDLIDKSIYLLELMSNEDCHQHQSFTYCRELKLFMMDELVSKTVQMVPADSFLKFVETISDQPRQDVPILGMLLFNFGDNPDAYHLKSLLSILSLSQIVVDNYDSLLKIIDKQLASTYKTNAKTPTEVLIKNAKHDFTHLLFLSQVNFLDAFTYLELDNEIKVNDSSKLVFHESIKKVYANIEKLLPYFAHYGYKSITSRNINIAIYNKLQSNSDEFNLYFDKYDIKVSYQKADIMKSDKIDFFYVFLMDKYPFVPYMSSNFYNHSISFRFYQRDDIGTRLSNITNIDPNVKITYNMKGINSQFTEAARYDHLSNEFIKKNYKSQALTVDKNQYTEITITEVGDYTFGVKGLAIQRGMTWQTWAIIAGSIIGGIIFGVGAFFGIKAYLKKRKRDAVNPVEDIEPILASMD